MTLPRSDRPREERPRTAELLAQLVGELGHLVAQHIALAKVELGASARRTGIGVAQVAACAPLVLVGYAFLNAALALALGRWLPLAAAVALVGLFNVAVGTLGVVLAARAFRRPMLDDSVSEIERTAHVLAPRITHAMDSHALDSHQ